MYGKIHEDSLWWVTIATMSNVWFLWPCYLSSVNGQSAVQCVRNSTDAKTSVTNGMTVGLVISHYHCLLSLHFAFFSVPWKSNVHESNQSVHSSSGFLVGLANKVHQQEVKWWEESEVSIYFLWVHHRLAGYPSLLSMPLVFGNHSIHSPFEA